LKNCFPSFGGSVCFGLYSGNKSSARKTPPIKQVDLPESAPPGRSTPCAKRTALAENFAKIYASMAREGAASGSESSVPAPRANDPPTHYVQNISDRPSWSHRAARLQSETAPGAVDPGHIASGSRTQALIEHFEEMATPGAARGSEGAVGAKPVIESPAGNTPSTSSVSVESARSESLKSLATSEDSVGRRSSGEFKSATSEAPAGTETPAEALRRQSTEHSRRASGGSIDLGPSALARGSEGAVSEASPAIPELNLTAEVTALRENILKSNSERLAGFSGYDATVFALACHGNRIETEGIAEQLEKVALFCSGADPGGYETIPPILISLADSGKAGWAIVEKIASKQPDSQPRGSPRSDVAAASEGNASKLTMDELRTFLKAVKALQEGTTQAPGPAPLESNDLAARARAYLLAPQRLATKEAIIAVRAVQQGFYDSGAGSDYAFANERLKKACTQAERATNEATGRFGKVENSIGNAVHKNPFGKRTLDEARKKADRLDSDPGSKSGVLASAEKLSKIFAALNKVFVDGGAAAGALPAHEKLEDFAYNAAIFSHWAARPLASQQRIREVTSAQREEIKSAVRDALPGSEFVTDEVRTRQSARVDGLTKLAPEELQEIGWRLIEYLQTKIDSVASNARISSPQQDGVSTAPNALISALAGIQAADPLHQTGQRRLDDEITRALDTLKQLRSSLLQIKSEGQKEIEGLPAFKEAKALQKSAAANPKPPLERLADDAEKFRIGDSVTAANGRATGISLPIGQAINMAFTGHGGFGVICEVAAKMGKEAFFQVGIHAIGGDLVFGNMSRDILSGKVGAGGGGVVHEFDEDDKDYGLAFGGSAFVHGALEQAGNNSVVLRIPRTGSAVGVGYGVGKPGVEGDGIVAKRMADVLRSLQELSEGNEDDMVGELLATFEDLQVTVVRDGDRLIGEKSERTGRIGVEGGFAMTFTLKDGRADDVETDDDWMGAAETGEARYGITGASASVGLEGMRQSKVTQERGEYAAKQSGHRHGLRMPLNASIGIPLSGFPLLNINTKVIEGSAGSSVKLAREGGQPNANSVMIQQAQSSTTGEGKKLIESRILELSASKLGLYDSEKLRALCSEVQPNEVAEHIDKRLEAKASELKREIGEWPSIGNSMFSITSAMKAEVREEIGKLYAIKRLAEGSEAAKGTAESAAARMDVLENALDSYRASSAGILSESSGSNRVATPMFVLEKSTTVKATAYERFL